jgi:hypothetical protein
MQINNAQEIHQQLGISPAFKFSDVRIKLGNITDTVLNTKFFAPVDSMARSPFMALGFNQTDTIRSAGELRDGVLQGHEELFMSSCRDNYFSSAATVRIKCVVLSAINWMINW